LIEVVSGKLYEDFISENIIKKLQLSSNELGFEIVNFDEHAKGYHKRLSFTNLVLGFIINKSKFMDKPEGKWKPFKDFYVNGAAYGGLIGKPAAFVTYIRELLRNHSLLISPEGKRFLFRENKSNNKKATGMCLSWFKGNLNGREYFTHAGGGGGFYCEIRIYPDAKLGSVIFFNRTGMTDERFLDKVDSVYLKINAP
jgi:CubicO group peptidase (beta-lactamase class C family)